MAVLGEKPMAIDSRQIGPWGTGTGGGGGGLSEGVPHSRGCPALARLAIVVAGC
jgi:hypothetical protein